MVSDGEAKESACGEVAEMESATKTMIANVSVNASRIVDEVEEETVTSNRGEAVGEVKDDDEGFGSDCACLDRDCRGTVDLLEGAEAVGACHDPCASKNFLLSPVESCPPLFVAADRVPVSRPPIWPFAPTSFPAPPLFCDPSLLVQPAASS